MNCAQETILDDKILTKRDRIVVWHHWIPDKRNLRNAQRLIQETSSQYFSVYVHL